MQKKRRRRKEVFQLQVVTKEVLRNVVRCWGMCWKLPATGSMDSIPLQSFLLIIMPRIAVKVKRRPCCHLIRICKKTKHRVMPAKTWKIVHVQQQRVCEILVANEDVWKYGKEDVWKYDKETSQKCCLILSEKFVISSTCCKTRTLNWATLYTSSISTDKPMRILVILLADAAQK